MPYISSVPKNIDTDRYPVFVVFRRGKIVTQGTAQELQYLFNIRARQLKIKLLDLCRQPDDCQDGNEYQVMRLHEWEQLKTNVVLAADMAFEEAANTFTPPATVLEEELLYNPNDIGLRQRIKHSKSKWFRYKRKHLVSRLIAREQFPSPDEIVLSADDKEKLVSTTDSAAIENSINRFGEQLSVTRAQPKNKNDQAKGNRWDAKLTPIEEEHMAVKRERYSAVKKNFWI